MTGNSRRKKKLKMVARFETVETDKVAEGLLTVEMPGELLCDHGNLISFFVKLADIHFALTTL
jgi:hypothetical protein